MDKSVIVKCLVIFSLGLCGCSPDEMEIALSTKSLRDVATGHVSSADLSVSFVNELGNIKQKLPQIREAVSPYLGKFGKLRLFPRFGKKLIGISRSSGLVARRLSA